MKYNILLWDVDDTLLDFGYSERYAIKHCFQLIGKDIPEEWISRYAQINLGYWKRLEKGEVTKAEVLKCRFADLFQEMKISITEEELAKFQTEYQKALGKVYRYRDDSFWLCQKLKSCCRQYLVTNGVESTQRNKLRLSGLDALMEDIFISENIGFVKPQKEFFDACFAEIPDFSKERVLLIGDSLSSDMQGARNAGIACCWYNPEGKEAAGITPDYTIRNLWEAEKIIQEQIIQQQKPYHELRW